MSPIPICNLSCGRSELRVNLFAAVRIRHAPFKMLRTVHRRFPLAQLLLALLATTGMQAADSPVSWPAVESISGPGLLAGDVAVPTAMRRLPAFIIELNPETRVGTFRLERDGTVIQVLLLPHCEFLYHGGPGELSQFQPGQRCIVRLHQDHQGDWRLATYVKDDLCHQLGHQQSWRVDHIEPAERTIHYTIVSSQATGPSGVFLVNSETRVWKHGEPATLDDIRVGDCLRVQGCAVGAHTALVAADVILDDESLATRFREPQRSRQARRFEQDGLRGYVMATEPALIVMLFRASGDALKTAPERASMKLTPTHWNEAPAGRPVTCRVASVQRRGRVVTLIMEEPQTSLTIGRTVQVQPVPTECERN